MDLGSLKRINCYFSWFGNKAPTTGCAFRSTCITGLPSNAGNDSTRILSHLWTASLSPRMRVWWLSGWWTKWASGGPKLPDDSAIAATTQWRTGGTAVWTARGEVSPLRVPRTSHVLSMVELKPHMLALPCLWAAQPAGLALLLSRPIDLLLPGRGVTPPRPLPLMPLANWRLSTLCPLLTARSRRLWPRLLTRTLLILPPWNHHPWSQTIIQFPPHPLGPSHRHSSCHFPWTPANNTATSASRAH